MKIMNMCNYFNTMFESCFVQADNYFVGQKIKTVNEKHKKINI